jgi:hypothetical protein
MSTINGIGTTYIGQADVKKDGSYITTKWLSFVIPIVPLGSMRVWPQSQTTRYIPVFYTTSEFEVKRVPLHISHIIQVYAIYLAVILFFNFVDFFTSNNSNHHVCNPTLASLIAIACAIFILKISASIRKSSTLVSIVALLIVMVLTFLFAADISITPVESWTMLYYFWGAYFVFCTFMFLKNDKPTNEDTKKRR